MVAAAQDYITTIGIECHVQLKTATKLFAAVDNDARSAAPNSLISPICLGLPGALPVLNVRAVELASRAAFALGTRPQKHSAFDRKHYFYPDLPLGYQITQFNHPIIQGGLVTCTVNGASIKVRIHEAHLEADAGKNTHPAHADHSLVDLNRAGTPLLEIVSEPDMHSPAEARAYVQELYLLMKYAGVSDVDLYHGNMRFDVNVSVSKTSELGTRTETKNLNSFRSVEKAAEYEVKRQIELLEKGAPIVQETRGWNEAKQKTFSQRGKEFAHDYRYMPEPDIPPIELDDNFIASIAAGMPVLPTEWRERLANLGLDDSQTAILLHAEAENELVSYLPLLEEQLGDKNQAKQWANWMVNVEIPLRSDASKELSLKDAERQELYSTSWQLLQANKLSSTSAKSLLIELLQHDSLPHSIEQFAASQGYIQVSDTKEIEKVVKQVITNHPQAVADVKNGEMKAIGFLVGQVMKLSQGKANPQLAQQLIKKQLEQ
jgi:aspartyl-tRNA(Asn)/glutamyl-tRNA(Gln) amidotransferase subunit B